MSERFTLRAAVYLILRKENQVLLSRRFNTGYEDGKYSLVAGHLDGDESALSTMIRETKEETGIEVTLEDLKFVHAMHRKANYEYIDLYFECSKWVGEIEIREPEKCDSLEWFDLENLPENLTPEVKQALNCFKQKIYFSELNI